MSFSHDMQINEMDEYANSVNDESFSNDESSNDFNPVMQIANNNNNSMPSTLSHAQRNAGSSPIHKTRSGLKYNPSKDNGNLKRVNGSGPSSFTDHTSPSPSKILNSENVSAIVCNQWIPNISNDREDVTQDVEDDEDDVMDYDEDYQTETQDSAVSSPQTSTNKYKTPSSTKKFVEESVIDDNSIISSTLTYNLEANLLDSSFVSHSVECVTSESPSTSQTQDSKLINTRQMRNRSKNHNIRVSKRTGSKPESKPAKVAKDSISEENVFLIPRYPLRSRARLEKVKCRLRESVEGTKTLGLLPIEIYYRIFQYLPIQDLFRIQRINKRFKDSVEKHLFMVKRINFSCGLPFAFLPDCLNDIVLKRILSKTPEVTHILGFYPRKIEEAPGIYNSLTYNGIISALRQCSKLRSVEIMDLELMSRIVLILNRVKFHGMFRNRPYSWDEEYVNPFITKNQSSSNISLFQSLDSYSPNKMATSNKLAALKSLFNLINTKQSQNVFTNYITYSWMSFLEKMTYTSTGAGLPMLQPINQGPVMNFVTPIPPSVDKLLLPNVVNNLTKLDLVSVCVQQLPRLENIKYLHLKWVRFSSADPFSNFQAPKIQSFVMNNCIGPMRAVRYVRIFSALARAPQLNRLELVSTRTIEGLFENFVPDTDQGNRCFHNLQRLVLASNKEFAEVDVAAVLLSSHACLNHLALSVSHSRNSLMLALANAGVVMQKLESIILGYQDPFQSMMTGIEIQNIGLHDSPDHTMPICKITDRGIAALIKISPKLISLHLRHAIFVEDPSLWLPKKWPYPIGSRDVNNYQNFNNTGDNDDQMCNSLLLKSLTLENCPNIRPDSLAFILNHPASCFPQLEMLVLRDMFAPLPPCPIPQHNIDYSLFDTSILTKTSNRGENESSSFNPSCCGSFHKSNLSSSCAYNNTVVNTQLLDGLNDRFCQLYPIVQPGTLNRDSLGSSSSQFMTQSTSSSNLQQMGSTPAPNINEIFDVTLNTNNNRFSRFFLPNLTPTDFRLSNDVNNNTNTIGNIHNANITNNINNSNNNTATSTNTGIFGMSSYGLSLYNAAGAQVISAQHINLGSSIRPNEFIRHPIVVGAMKNISMIHKLESMGLSQLALWNRVNDQTDGRSNDTHNSCNDLFPKNLLLPISESDNYSNRTFNNQANKSSKRKRTRSNDKNSNINTSSFNNTSNLGLLFQKSILNKNKINQDQVKQKSAKRRRVGSNVVPSSSNIQNNDVHLSPLFSIPLYDSSYSNSNTSYDFYSSGTQTCVCGHIDWLDSNWQRDILSSSQSSLCDDCSKTSYTNYNSSRSNVSSASQIGSMQMGQNNNNFKNTKGNMYQSKHSASFCKSSIVKLMDYECKLCSFPLDNNYQTSLISLSKPEPELEHTPREWEAQDVSCDTASLRLFIKPQLYKLELKQNSFAHLTTLHMEKVGLTHLVLVSCHRLKSITLENCPELQSIVINTGNAAPSDSMPGLRRIRIMRCPKFAIYNLFYHITRFYPQHDDNLYITYRPFGEYNPLVEKALWLNSDSQHVMVSHEYRQGSSERNLEELCSSFDQLFREMLNFSESLIRRDILTVSDFSQVNNFTNGSFLRSEHGTDWDLMTDIPWISEVCCSMLPSDLSRTQQADQLYELLSEIQSHLGNMKLRRRGIHLHVQFRDVHPPSPIPNINQMNNSTADSADCLFDHMTNNYQNFSYLPQRYTDDYLHSTHPALDVNANYCQPDLKQIYPDFFTQHQSSLLNSDSSINPQTVDPFDKYLYMYQKNHTSKSNSDNFLNSSNDLSILPSHLRRLLQYPSSNTCPKFGPDIDEKIPIPHNITSDKAFRNTLNNQQLTNNLRSDNKEISTSSTNTSQQINQEFIVNKLHRFRNTITALKNNSMNNAKNTNSEIVMDLAHSTRSKTAEMISSFENSNNIGRQAQKVVNNNTMSNSTYVSGLLAANISENYFNNTYVSSSSSSSSGHPSTSNVVNNNNHPSTSNQRSQHRFN